MAHGEGNIEKKSMTNVHLPPCAIQNYLYICQTRQSRGNICRHKLPALATLSFNTLAVTVASSYKDDHRMAVIKHSVKFQ